MNQKKEEDVRNVEAKLFRKEDAMLKLLILIPIFIFVSLIPVKAEQRPTFDLVLPHVLIKKYMINANPAFDLVVAQIDVGEVKDCAVVNFITAYDRILIVKKKCPFKASMIKAKAIYCLCGNHSPDQFTFPDRLVRLDVLIDGKWKRVYMEQVNRDTA